MSYTFARFCLPSYIALLTAIAFLLPLGAHSQTVTPTPGPGTELSAPPYTAPIEHNPTTTATEEIQEGLDVIEEPLGLPGAGDAPVSPNFPLVVARLIRTFLSFLGIVLVVLIIYGGFLWMTAGGSDEQVAKAKKTIYGAIIGFIIIFMANSIIAYLINALTSAIYGPSASL